MHPPNTQTPRSQRGRRRRAGDLDGGYGVVEVAITWPVFLLIALFGVQASLVWHARHVAQAAALEGVRAGRGYQARTDDGQAAASAYLQRVAPHLISSPQVSTTSTPTQITVTVRGRVLSLTTLWPVDLVEHATAQRERFVPPGGAP